MGRIPLTLVLALAACGGERVCARAAAAPAEGDANGDGVADIADVAALHHLQVAGGAAPACRDAVDLVELGVLDHGDAFTLASALYTGAFTLPGAPSCPDATPWEPGPCGRLGVTLDADDATVTVSLRSADLPIEAWSLGLAVDGCDVAAARTAGTAGAERRLDPAGHRDVGFDYTFVADGGATSAVLLGWLDRVALPVGEAVPVLALDLARPASGCVTCEIDLVDGLAGPAGPVAAVASSGGHAYPLPSAHRAVRVCAP